MLFLIFSYLAKDTIHTCTTGMLSCTFRKNQEDKLVRFGVIVHHEYEARKDEHADDDNKSELH